LLGQKSEVTSSEQRSRVGYAIATAAISVLLAGSSLVWQAFTDHQRLLEVRQEHQQLLQNYAYDSGSVNSLVGSIGEFSCDIDIM
jgi:hypothetical protein